MTNVNFFFFKVGHRSRSEVKIFCMSGKPLSQGTYMSNIKALSEMVQELSGQGQFFLQSRSQVISGKPLSQGTYIPNMKALSETVQKL